MIKLEKKEKRERIDLCLNIIRVAHHKKALSLSRRKRKWVPTLPLSEEIRTKLPTPLLFGPPWNKSYVSGHMSFTRNADARTVMR